MAKPVKTTEIDPTGQVSHSVVYSADNIAKASNAKAPNYAKMSVDKLGSTIAKAKNKAELNQVKIMNTPLSMGVITGQAAHMANINNAQINALAGIYDAKNTELERKRVAEQQKFDNDLALKNFDLNQRNTLSQIAERGKPKAAQVLANFGAGLQRGEGGSVDFANYQQAKDQAIKSGVGITGTDFDNAYASMLSDGDKQKFNIGLTPLQQAKQEQDYIKQEQELVGKQTKANEISLLVDSIKTDDNLSRVLGPLDQYTPTWRAGSVNVTSKIDQLKSITQLANMGVMKGVLSDSDMKVIAQASNRLSYGMSVSDFNAALDEIKNKVSNALITQSNPDTIVEKNGKKYRKVQGGWEEIN